MFINSMLFGMKNKSDDFLMISVVTIEREKV